MKNILPILLFFIATGLYAQQPQANPSPVAIIDTTEKDEVYTLVDELPEYPGGDEGLLKFLKKNIKYPLDAMDCECEGTVYISFIINEQGKVISPKYLKLPQCGGILYIYPNGKVKKDKPGKDATEFDCSKAPKFLAQEAVRVITSTTGWKPGRQNGKPVKVKYVLPVKFTLR